MVEVVCPGGRPGGQSGEEACRGHTRPIAVEHGKRF